MSIQINKESAYLVQRSIVMSAVVILHFFLLKFPWTTRVKQAPMPFESTVLLLPDKTPPPKPSVTAYSLKNTQPLISADTEHVERKEPDTPPEPIATSSLSEASSVTASAWRAATDAEIQQAVKRITAKPSVRQFGESTQQTPPAPETSALFSEPAHRFGETTKTPDGGTIVWLSENCYQETVSDSARFNSFSTGMPTAAKTYLRCKKSIGRPQANSHLFEDLKRHSETPQ